MYSIGVRRAQCPVLDDESEVQYRGLRLTAMRRAALSVPGWMFPNGFFVVVIVKENDDACRPPPAPPAGSSSARDGNSPRDRVKHFRLSVRSTLPYRRYVVVGLLTLGLVFAFYGAAELIALCRWPRGADEAAGLLHSAADGDGGAADGDGGVEEGKDSFE
ncbi:SID1 transmembrane family member 2 [Eumeta japonica]|uniref:SID1 transmembrane family member 2 n=1 Tax=Eumeta variegata TaxID=151549 RepID=A0A4C1ZWL6_EUMVA|nr:SID1 transmembrane family member 2 [Eumeta japonica]